MGAWTGDWGARIRDFAQRHFRTLDDRFSAALRVDAGGFEGAADRYAKSVTSSASKWRCSIATERGRL